MMKKKENVTQSITEPRIVTKLQNFGSKRVDSKFSHYDCEGKGSVTLNTQNLKKKIPSKLKTEIRRDFW